MLSKKSQYAFKALTYLAEKFNEGPVLISEISKKKKIPLKFLENKKGKRRRLFFDQSSFQSKSGRCGSLN